MFTEAPSIAPTPAAIAADDTEPAQTRATEIAESTKLAPVTAEAVESGPRPSDLLSASATGIEDQPKETGRGPTGAADLPNAARAKQPDVVPSPARETATASPAPRMTDITPDEQRFREAEADALLTRGDEFFASGDLISARLFYEHAAAAGNGVAALRLGGTFDPAFLARVHIGQVQGDIPSALYWYRRARDLGNGDAEILLKRVENTVR
jgi:hypothetical protein